MSDPTPAAEALRREGRLPNGEWPPTERQVKYLDALRRRLDLPKRMLDDHAVWKSWSEVQAERLPAYMAALAGE